MADRPRALRPRWQYRAVWLALCAGIAPWASAQDAAPPATPPAAPADQPAAPEQPPLEPPKYPVSRFVIEYATENPNHPDPQLILESAVVTLGTVGGGYVEPREGVPTVTLRVSEIAEQPMQRFNLLALSTVVRAIFEAYRQHGLVGVVVDASGDIYLPMRRDPQTGRITLDRNDPNAGKDLRPETRPGTPTELHLVVYTGVVTQVRTQAAGERIGENEDRINNPKHDWIREHSPVQPGESSSQGGLDLLRKDQVDDYMARLSRHPGRRVDAAVSAGEAPGEIALDYIVSESKPWTIYAEVSNTGTEETNEWRQKFGYSNTQLTGNDDVLSIEYVTAGFEDTNAVLGSYERPIGGSRQWHAKVYGSWNQYLASDVGVQGQDFEGDGYLLAAELSRNVYQSGPVFIDMFGGARWQHVRVENPGAINTVGETDFLVPYLGARLERRTDVENTFASLSVEGNISSVTDEDQLENLGRLQTSADWIAVRGEGIHSFFLEPIINRRAWEDIEHGSPTLAHEVLLSLRGQYAFGNRLVPNYEQVIGGLTTVRGYKESVAAGDTMWVASAEYRWHVPWGMKYDPTPGSFFGKENFHWKPSQPYGRADWDLVLKTFLDVGQTYNSDRLSFEDDETLAGAGVGVELSILRNFMLRVDWGIALLDTEAGQVNTSGGFDREVDAGDNRIHVLMTLSY